MAQNTPKTLLPFSYFRYVSIKLKVDYVQGPSREKQVIFVVKKGGDPYVYILARMHMGKNPSKYRFFSTENFIPGFRSEIVPLSPHFLTQPLHPSSWSHPALHSPPPLPPPPRPTSSSIWPGSLDPDPMFLPLYSSALIIPCLFFEIKKKF